MSEIADFIPTQQTRMLEELGQLRDDMRVMAATLQRLESTMQGLINEMRAWRLNQN